MARDRKGSIYEQRQKAYRAYVDVRERHQSAYIATQSALEERKMAGNRLHCEWEILQAEKSYNQGLWDEYHRIRDTNSAKIKLLKEKSDAEHRQMHCCLERASDYYRRGKRDLASHWSEEGNCHRECRDELNAEAKRLACEVTEAKRYVREHVQEIDSLGLDLAKEAFELAKGRHETAKEELERLKSERDRLKKRFDALCAEHSKPRNGFCQELVEIGESTTY